MKCNFKNMFFFILALGMITTQAEPPKANPARSVHATEYDTSQIVGHIGFQVGESEDKVIAAAKTLDATEPGFTKIAVRQDGEKTYGIDFTYSGKHTGDLGKFSKLVSKIIREKHGKNAMRGYDVSNKVLWIKK